MKATSPHNHHFFYISINSFGIVNQKVSNSSGLYFSTAEISRAWENSEQGGLGKLQLYLDCLDQIIGVGGKDINRDTHKTTHP